MGSPLSSWEPLLVSTTGTCPGFVVGQHGVQMVNNGISDAAAIWIPSVRLGWGLIHVEVEMALNKSSAAYLPADGWAIVIADGGSGTLGGIGGALGVPYTRTGLSIEWRFYNTDPNVDQVDTITVRRLTGSGSGTILAGPTPLPAGISPNGGSWQAAITFSRNFGGALGKALSGF